MVKGWFAAALCLACWPTFAADQSWQPDTSRGMYEAARVLATYTYGANLSDDQKTQMAYAMGWFAASLKTMDATGAFSPEMSFVCPASGLTSNKLAREYVDYVDAEKGDVSDDPLVVLVEALKRDYPCK